MYRTATRPSTEFEGRAPPDYTGMWRGGVLFLKHDITKNNVIFRFLMTFLVSSVSSVRGKFQ